jgi:hypothetical protein
VIQCEYNQLYGPDQLITNKPFPKKWEGRSNFEYISTSFGASAAALNLVASAAGYTCVYLLHDIIFVRNDVLSACACKKAPPFGAIVNGKIPRHIGFRPCSEEHLSNLLEVHSILSYPHLEVPLVPYASAPSALSPLSTVVSAAALNVKNVRISSFEILIYDAGVQQLPRAR